MDNEQTKHTFHVRGMHCKSCVLLIEDSLSGAPGVEGVDANLGDHTVTVTTKDVHSSRELARELTGYVESHGYGLEVDKPAFRPRWGDFKYAAPIALAIIAAFVVLQKTGLVNLVSSDEVSLPVAFLIGVIASFSSCLAVVGGLLLSISANYAKEDGRLRPHLMFHAARLAAFFLLGGVIGAIGSAFTLSIGASVALNVLVGLVMLVLGLNLLDVFPWAKRLQPHMPKFLARSAARSHKVDNGLAPALVGVATFFLPCGFTQSMQLYTLSTGGFAAGAMTMFVFALGTLPVLALISFTSQSLGKGSAARTSVFFKTAGILVIAFALLNAMNALAVLGIISPLVNL